MKNNTINKKEIDKFSRIAEEWWNPEGKFKPQHKFNPIRISYIKENIIGSFKLKNKKKPLEKVKILDTSWHLPNADRNSFEEYKSEHIVNAIFFDIDKYSNKAQQYFNKAQDKIEKSFLLFFSPFKKIAL